MSGARPSRSAILLDAADHVATALVSLAKGQAIATEVATVTLAAAIPRGHKFAIRPIAPGEPVLKYGQPIGRATAPIAPGEHVHTHNLASQRAGGPKAHAAHARSS